MRMTRVLSVFLLFSAIPYYSGALDPRVRASSGQSWELAASNASVNASIGSSVAIGGDTVVVGSIGGGPVYVYEKPAGGWRNMLQTAELTPSTGGFGDTVVAISGDTIIVGSGLGGDVYVFVKPSGGWTNMTETARLSDGVTGDYFGISVAIDGSTIVVGATGTEVNGTQEQGSAYVFVEPPTGWATTSAFDAELTSSNGTYVDLFGVSVRVSGKTIVVGAPFDDDRTGPGAVYVFVEPATGWANMTQTAELTESQQGLYDEFGFSVAFAGDTIAAGAPQASDGGAAYVFVEPATGWADMTETAQLLPSDPTQNFGFSIGTSGKQVVVGTFSGTTNLVFVYAEPEGGWQSTSTASVLLSRGQKEADFGYSVAIGSGVVVAGAPYQTVDGHGDQGAAFVFELTQH